MIPASAIYDILKRYENANEKYELKMNEKNDFFHFKTLFHFSRNLILTISITINRKLCGQTIH